MRLTSLIVTGVAVTVVNGLSFIEARNAAFEYVSSSIEVFKRAVPELPKREVVPRKNNCPAIWTTIVSDLNTMFLGSDGQCNDDARAAIRECFHDCGTWDKTQGSTGGCDGSLILASEAYNRAENGGLQNISTKLTALSQKYPSVSIADLIIVASSVAIVTCPGGPRVQTYVGRKDSSTPAPNGRLPDAHADAASLSVLFANKGFDAVDLAALIGAHSTSKAFTQPDMPFGAAQDSTPGLWDIDYYAQTLSTVANVFSFQADRNLAGDATVGKEFKGFVGNKGKWNGKFADAMARMQLLGVPGGSKNLLDCTNVIPRGTNNKREMRAAPINDRIR
ncbi:Versatile peroxidase [Lachnellula hyalina]|uniref:Peroxidase n=1 Tax=Lachnellula hyalina TaxID=1316788 RepID=A0A8H8TYQ1_9HELO|nr:Versatile peroxidase [Lachnellula hyalina]TVY27414.1 Versatile peroxidase [Lachnellula hyalina]